MKLAKFVVYVPVVAFGETEEDAIEYVEDALNVSDFMDCDGIVAILDLTDVAIEEYEEDVDETSN